MRFTRMKSIREGGSESECSDQNVSGDFGFLHMSERPRVGWTLGSGESGPAPAVPALLSNWDFFFPPAHA